MRSAFFLCEGKEDFIRLPFAFFDFYLTPRQAASVWLPTVRVLYR